MKFRSWSGSGPATETRIEPQCHAAGPVLCECVDPDGLGRTEPQAVGRHPSGRHDGPGRTRCCSRAEHVTQDVEQRSPCFEIGSIGSVRQQRQGTRYDAADNLGEHEAPGQEEARKNLPGGVRPTIGVTTVAVRPWLPVIAASCRSPCSGRGRRPGPAPNSTPSIPCVSCRPGANHPATRDHRWTLRDAPARPCRETGALRTLQQVG